MNTLREIADDPLAVLAILGITVLVVIFGVPSWINAYRYWRMSKAEKAAAALAEAERISNINPFEKFRALGETFQYCGRVCVVTGHWEHYYSSCFAARVPLLSADYSDNDGVIRSVSFNITQLDVLRAENHFHGVEAGPGDVRE